jgi:hypothetical protein
LCLLLAKNSIRFAVVVTELQPTAHTHSLIRKRVIFLNPLVGMLLLHTSEATSMMNLD